MYSMWGNPWKNLDFDRWILIFRKEWPECWRVDARSVCLECQLQGMHLILFAVVGENQNGIPELKRGDLIKFEAS